MSEPINASILTPSILPGETTEVTIDGVTYSGTVYGDFAAAKAANSTVVVTGMTYENADGAAYGSAFRTDTAPAATTTVVVDTVFSNNKTSNSGTIYSGSGALILKDVEFTGNAANSGWGGGAIYANGAVTLDGVDFTGNSTQQYGGALMLYTNGTANLKNVTFNGNSATRGGGAIYNYGAVTIDGLVTLKTASDTLVKAGSGTFTVSSEALKSGDETLAFNKFLDAEFSHSYENLISAESGYSIVKNGNDLYLKNDAAEYTSAAIVSADADIYQAIVGDVTYAGFGYSDYATAKADSRTIVVTGMTYENADGGAYGSAFRTDTAPAATTTVVVDTVFRNNKTSNSGTIYSGSGALILKDVEFTGNSADGGWGGGAIYANGTVTLDGVDFTGNTTQQYGGALVLGSSGSASLKNITFDGNTATRGGGAIYNNGGAITIDGLVTLKTASDTLVKAGSGTYTVTSETLKSGDETLAFNKFLDAEFSHNYESLISAESGYSIVKNGNDLYLKNDTAEYTSAAIVSANADVYQTVVGDVTYAGAGYSDYATAKAASRTIVVTGMTYENADGAAYGAAFRTDSPAPAATTTVVVDTVFRNNKTTASGGTIYSGSGELILKDVEFTGNSAAGGWGGGAIYANGNVTLDGVDFTGNTTQQYGGALMLYTGGTASLKNVTFDGNSATRGGGAIHTYGAVTFDGLVTLKTASDTLTRNNGTYTVTGNALQAGDLYSKFLDTEFDNNYETLIAAANGYQVLKYDNDFYVAEASTDFSSAVFSADGNEDALNIAGENVSGVAFAFDQIDMAKAWNARKVAFDGYESTTGFDTGSEVFKGRTTNGDSVVAFKDATVGGAHYYSYDAASVVNGNMTLLVEDSTFAGAVYGFGGGKVTGDVVMKIKGSTINGNLTASSSALEQESGDIITELTNSTLNGTLRGTGSTASISVQDVVISLDHSTANDIICLYGSGTRTGNAVNGAVSVTLDGSTVTNGIAGKNASYQTTFGGTVSLTITGSDASTVSGGISDMDAITIASGSTLNYSGSTLTTGSLVNNGTLNFDVSGVSVAEGSTYAKLVDAGSVSGSAVNYSNVAADNFVSSDSLFLYNVIDSTVTGSIGAEVQVSNGNGTVSALYGVNVFGSLADARAANGGAVVINSSKTVRLGGVDTVIAGGSYTQALLGGEAYTEDAVVSGSYSVTIDGGSYSKAMAAGDAAAKAVSVTRTGDIEFNIKGGAFASTSHVAGGMFYNPASSEATPASGSATLNGSVNFTISGGTFDGRVFGGCNAKNDALGANTLITGDVTLTIDASESAIAFNEHVIAGSRGAGSILGDVLVNVTGSGDNLSFGNGGVLFGGSNADYASFEEGELVTDSAVSGDRRLVFNDFEGAFGAQVRLFRSLELTGGSAVNFTSAALNLRLVENWDFSFGSSATGVAANSFAGDSLDFDLTGYDNSDWEVLSGDGIVSSDLALARSVTLGGEEAVLTDGAWCSASYSLSIDDDAHKMILTSNLAN